ncbi:MAG: glycosyltransferase [Candidatus Omnitrophota bacterium]
MDYSVAGIITTAARRENDLLNLLSALEELTIPLQKIYIIYDGTVSLSERILKSGLTQAVVWIRSASQVPITFEQNKVISQISQKYILLMNDDIIPDPYFLQFLISSLEQMNEVGMGCGKLIRMDKQTIDSAGQIISRSRRPIDRGYGEKDRGQFDTPGFVFGCCGAAVLYRRDMLQDISISPGEYFDNEYNMFYDDLDISWRAQNQGWKAFYNPKAIAYHHRGLTAKINKPKLKFLEKYSFAWLSSRLKSDLVKNRYMTIIKNDNLKGFILNLPFIFLYDLKLWTYLLIFDLRAAGMLLKKTKVILKAWEKRRIIFENMKKS